MIGRTDILKRAPLRWPADRPADVETQTQEQSESDVRHGIIRIHQCISGFTQSEDRIHGVLKLAEKLHDRGFNNCVSRVSLRAWNCDWSEVAENLWLLGQHHNAEVLVNVYCYSWGGGWGAVQLATELQKRGVNIQTIVSSDAVYRHPRLCLRWLSLLKRDSSLSPVIRIPANVSEVIPLHQRMNTPQGHRIVGATGFSGIIRPSQLVNRTHQYMDDAPEFHDLALDAASRLGRVN